jgi:pimeloyl-ACP methyl ester carboxylesterase
MRRLPALVLLALCGCSSQAQQTAIDRLKPCTNEDGPTDAYCGALKVFENRETKSGRTIDLKIVVLPALSSDSKPDPLFFLAGGPGQGAAQMARPLRELLRRVQQDRDIVLVDQRGTGKSNPLNCSGNTDSLTELDETEDTGVTRFRKCLQGYDADPRLYTTSIAMDDLDEVRAFLGYERINLYGGSYGTRAALEYLRRHEPHVRAMVIDGVAPPELRLPLFFPRDAQRALDLLLADCEKDEECRKLHPQLSDRVRALVQRLDKEPAKVRLVHPRTGVTQDVTVKGSLVAGALFGALYSPLASSLIPALIERAERNDFQGMLALMMMNDGVAENMAVGMQFSVICAEDAPRIAPEEQQRASTGTVFGKHLIEARMKICEFWPKGSVEPGYYEPVKSSVPSLVLSGELDPVTPPSWGEMVQKNLSNSRHLIAPGTGHGVISTGCGMRIVRDFIDRGTADGLNDSCLKSLKRPPFFLTPAGPDPARAGGSTP